MSFMETQKQKVNYQYKYLSSTRPKPEQCEICGIFGKELKKGLCFDHDHKTGEFRGWICGRCNCALGLVKDNTETLLALVEYINKNK